jgi:hypothetical protein
VTRISNRGLVLVGSVSFAAALIVAASSAAPKWGLFAENAITSSLAAASRDRPAVVLVFRPRDCGSGIESLAWWNAVHQAREASVTGLLVGADRATAQTIRSGAGLHFPIKTVSDAAVARGLAAVGYRDTPVVLIADRQGRVRSAAQLDFDQGRTVRHLLRELREIAAERVPEEHTITVTRK